MNVNLRGLELDPSANLGVQDYTANNWTGYNLGIIPYENIGGDNIGAFNFNSTPAGISQSKFFISNSHTIGTVRFPDFEPLGTFIDWFESVSGTENVSLLYSMQCSKGNVHH
ncbi:MAG: hypothetical protein IPG39_06230 [Bacteroidetes bacterium]|nr:hypothetical protein [Bacteroidota bacterium]